MTSCSGLLATSSKPFSVPTPLGLWKTSNPNRIKPRSDSKMAKPFRLLLSLISHPVPQLPRKCTRTRYVACGATRSLLRVAFAARLRTRRYRLDRESERTYRQWRPLRALGLRARPVRTRGRPVYRDGASKRRTALNLLSQTVPLSEASFRYACRPRVRTGRARRPRAVV